MRGINKNSRVRLWSKLLAALPHGAGSCESLNCVRKTEGVAVPALRSQILGSLLSSKVLQDTAVQQHRKCRCPNPLLRHGSEHQTRSMPA
jgi:hypothetical protein